MKNIKKFEKAEQGVELIEATRQTEDLQWVKYKNSIIIFHILLEYVINHKLTNCQSKYSLAKWEKSLNI
jgi:hypothetical protein